MKSTTLKVPKPIRQSSGNYYIYMRLGGKKYPVTEPTEARCIRRAQQIKADYLNNKKIAALNASNKSLKTACLEYINSSRGRLSPSTIQGYEKIVNNSFETLMNCPIYNITGKMVQSAVDAECRRVGRSGAPRSPKSVYNDYNFIAQILRINNADVPRPRLPELRPLPVQILTPEQVYSAVAGTEIELPCLLAMWLTLTISEIRGLTKSKSIRNGQLSVVETVVDIAGKPVRKQGGKEVNRARTMNIPPYIAQLIDNVDGDIICPLSSQAVNKRLQRLLIKHDLPTISFHKLRHIAASTMIALNIPAAYVRAAGGWKTDNVMNTVYVHTYTDARREAENIMANYMQNIIDVQCKKQ